MKNKSTRFLAGILVLLTLQGCNLPGTVPPTETAAPPTEVSATELVSVIPTEIQHQTIPVSAPAAKPYPDVTSKDTAPEQRAPYGDSFDINRLERPFTQDMNYIPDMDIASFSISDDGEFYFVAIELVGKDPNNAAGIQYAVELHTNLDSFGDLLIVASPPFAEEWTAENIKIYSDTNRDDY